jgi:polyribonucleotide 5'-hydroxyl-kinase
LLICLVNTILVIGSERLQSEMLRRFSTYRTGTGENITLVKLDKSGGCVDRDDTFMQLTNEAIAKQYFFGYEKTVLSPHTQTLGYDEVLIYKIREGMTRSHVLKQSLPRIAHANTFLPGGVEETDQGLYKKVEPNTSMQHCILAIMYASVSDSQETIRDASVMGFVYVAEVDETKRRLRVLAPMTTRITDRPMIWGSWPEAVVTL